MLRPDIRVVFRDDYPNAPVYIRYDDCLYPSHVLWGDLEAQGLPSNFILEWSMSLPLEVWD